MLQSYCLSVLCSDVYACGLSCPKYLKFIKSESSCYKKKNVKKSLNGLTKAKYIKLLFPTTYELECNWAFFLSENTCVLSATGWHWLPKKAPGITLPEKGAWASHVLVGTYPCFSRGKASIFYLSRGNLRKIIYSYSYNFFVAILVQSHSLTDGLTNRLH